MELLLATNNLKKQRELAFILQDLGVTVKTQKELGLHVEPEENGTTYFENAYSKAAALCAASGMAAVADDSGLEVAALNGRPGVYSARYGGENLTDEERTALLLTEMSGKEDRSARFCCAIVCVFPDRSEPLVAEGVCQGQILNEPRGHGGFGYDPVFYLPEKNATMAEISEKEKNQISHRATALKALAELLKERIIDADK